MKDARGWLQSYGLLQLHSRVCVHARRLRTVQVLLKDVKLIHFVLKRCMLVAEYSPAFTVRLYWSLLHAATNPSYKNVLKKHDDDYAAASTRAAQVRVEEYRGHLIHQFLNNLPLKESYRATQAPSKAYFFLRSRVTLVFQPLGVTRCLPLVQNIFE